MTNSVRLAPATGPARGPSTAVEPEPQAPATVQCALCGHRFVPGADTQACARCPMTKRCAVTCCPNCGYEFITGSRLVDFVRRLFRR